jgi:hypothetical protein
VRNQRKRNKRDKKARIFAAASCKRLEFGSNCPLKSVTTLSADAKKLVDEKRKELDKADKKRIKVRKGLEFSVN